MNLIYKLKDIGLIEECYDCGHKSFHPIWWIKSLFRKHKKYIPNPYSDITPLQASWVMQEFFNQSKPVIFQKFLQKNPLPENKSGTIKFRRYEKNETLD